MIESLFQPPVGIVSSTGAVALFSAVVAVVGVFVAYQAYRGYRRNESRPMLYLALGIILLTAVPVVVHHGLNWLTSATEAEILLGITVAHLGGVGAILYALTRA